MVVPGGPTEFHGTKRYNFKKWQVVRLEPMDPTSGVRGETPCKQRSCGEFYWAEGREGREKGDL